jgi:hypothetical protein
MAVAHRFSAAKRYEAEDQRPSTMHVERDLSVSMAKQRTKGIMLSEVAEGAGRFRAFFGKLAVAANGTFESFEALSDEML